MERILQLYDNDGRSVIKVRTRLNETDPVLKARMFKQLPKEQRKNLDLRGIDFTSATLENIDGCRLDGANLTAATINNASNCSFNNAMCIGATFTGNMDNCTFENTKLTGITLGTPHIVIGGYFENGDMLVLNRRKGGWWISTAYTTSKGSVSLYYAMEDATGVAYSLSDQDYNRQISGLIANAVTKIRRIESNSEDQMMKMERDAAALRQQMHARSEFINGINNMENSESGDILNQPATAA